MVPISNWKKIVYRAIATPAIHAMKTLFPNEYGMDCEITDRHIEYPWVLENLPDYGQTVLDVGCSGSMLPFLIGALGHWVWGIDLRKAPHADYTFVQEDICDNHFNDNEFEIITAVSTIEHIKDDKKAIKEIKRILKPSGVFLMTVPYGRHRVTRFHRVYDYADLEELTHGFNPHFKFTKSPQEGEIALIHCTKGDI